MALENPALNERSFQRGVEEAEVAESRGMTATGTYAITGLLLVIVVAAAAFGWSQVEIVTVGGREETLTPAWTWLAFLPHVYRRYCRRFRLQDRPDHLRLVRLRRGVAPQYRLPLLRPEVRRDRLAGADRHVVHIPGGVPPLQPAHRQGHVTVCNRRYSGDGRFSPALHGGLAAVAAGGGFLLPVRPHTLGHRDQRRDRHPRGALNLTLDFAFIEKAAAAGAPRFMQWYGAFGLMLSLSWMYVSVLRLLALLRGQTIDERGADSDVLLKESKGQPRQGV